MRQRHKLKDSDADDFQITDMKQVMETMSTVTGYLTLLLIAIAAVSLLVGSIGIMNMMLVSVAERTREIGIRKAIGAQESTIITQFLSESILISFIVAEICLRILFNTDLSTIPMLWSIFTTNNTWIKYLAVTLITLVVWYVMGLSKKRRLK